MSYKVDEQYEHTSYGVLRFSRFTGKSQFFDVEPMLDGGISLEIQTARVDRHLNRDWIHPSTSLVRARMSSHQFVEAITSLNIGNGIPITLEYVRGMDIQEYQPTPTQRSQFDSEIKKEVAKASEQLNALQNELKALKSKSRINKSDIDQLEKKIAGLSSTITSTLPYIEKSFQEVLDKQTLKAKVELFSWIDDKVRRVGLDNLPSMLLEGKNG